MVQRLPRFSPKILVLAALLAAAIEGTRWRFCAQLRFSRYGASAYCVYRDKQSICVDLKEPTDADAL